MANRETIRQAYLILPTHCRDLDLRDGDQLFLNFLGRMVCDWYNRLGLAEIGQVQGIFDYERYGVRIEVQYLEDSEWSALLADICDSVQYIGDVQVEEING